ncbi:MAG: DASS family sodium-coupled anion symporter [Woeseiaceae bacterium]|nr:DASS family sodium-coupled anion symporter [Woeseiaceae bacterium]NIP22167.1 DASS family sodium-coupled anion symporter [Woeseiaceae bacterium]NIS91334.1 DASS family sodium-coupled anion symporter [Woeseiaceae bacterium]
MKKQGGRSLHQRIGLALGPALAVVMLLSDPPTGLNPAAWATAAVAVWMAIWWATEAIPIAATALLPIACFPILGAVNMADTTAPFANKVIYLFLGGFVVAFAMQRWNLHRRIALNVLQHAGGSGRLLVGGFLFASALISMWVMNTSTAMMLTPVAISVISVIHASIRELDDRARDHFQNALLLAVAYGSTIGGMTTLVGTLPNAMLAAFMLESYGSTVNFANWMMVGVPLALLMLPICWLALTRWAFDVSFRTSGEGQAELRKLREDLGSIGKPEIRISIVAAIMVIAWVGRPFWIQLPGLGALDDSGIAIAGAIAMFVIPSGDKKDPVLLTWKYAEQLPWGVILLFGGGLSLANAFVVTGLAEWIGHSLQVIGTLPLVLIVVAITTLIIFLTELTSNTATTATFLPIVGAVAIEAGFDPIVLAVPVTLAASCAFMLPVATPPNAIVFGSGMLTIPKMMRAGFTVNIAGVAVVTLAAMVLAPRFLN